jgi:hypothetical protein
MKKIFFLLTLSLWLGFNGTAQTTFEVPKDYKLVAREDYAPYKNDIVAATKWLEETPIGTEDKKRKEVNKFVITWLAGSPDVSIVMTEELLSIIRKHENYMAVYFGSYSRDVIQNKESNNFSAAKAGALSLIKVYQNGSKIKKFKAMDELVAAYQKGVIDSYVMENY